ncbi:MAG TPA: hypothetical protein VGP94_05440, partial [Tepidisphaeraceae bacterium]|nr:hypothetical protein [Tepidisphaeraceae bacterium]
MNIAPDERFSVFMDFTYTAATALNLVTINSSNENSVTVFANADLFAANEYIGNSAGGSGAYSQSEFVNSVSGSLNLGNTAGSNGTYGLSGSGSLNVFSNEYVGYAGTGVFTQSGGTHTVATSFGALLILGGSGGSSGAYDLSGGSLIVNGNEHVGGAAPGSFTQSGGSHAANGYLYVGYGVTGSYDLSGSGNLTAAANEYIGFGGIGSFTQTGGIHTVGGIETIAGANTGSYIHSSGSHTVGGDLYMGGSPGVNSPSPPSGSYTLSGTGGLAVTGNEYIGYTGAGTFTQSGGTHTVGDPSTSNSLLI